MKNTIRFFGIIALVALIEFSMTGCSLSTDSNDNTKDQQSGEEVELTSSYLASHATLGDGNVKNYYCQSLLTVSSNLTIYPGTTIRFVGGNTGLDVTSTAKLTMNGTKTNPIILKGTGDSSIKGLWGAIIIESPADNVMNYVNVLNAGNTYYYYGGVCLDNGKLAMTNCLIDKSSTNGVELSESSGASTAPTELSEFTGNTISNCTLSPIATYGYACAYHLRNLSNDNPFHTWTGNANNYVDITGNTNTRMNDSFTLHSLHSLNGGTYTTIPWYFEDGIWFDKLPGGADITIEAGADIMLKAGSYISVPPANHLIAEGTSTAPIKFRQPTGTTSPWDRIEIDSGSVGSKLNYCDISGGGSSLFGLIYMWAGSSNSNNAYLEINNTSLRNSQSYGLCLDGNYDYAVYNIKSSGSGETVTFSNNKDSDIFKRSTGVTVTSLSALPGFNSY